MKQSGYTLIEIVIVVVIIGILASIASQSFKTTEDNRRFEDTASEMEALARAIVGDERLITNGSRTDFGYVGDVGALPSSLDNLVVNPGGYSTWNGPYIRSNFSENTDDYKRDAWNNLYTYTGGVTLSSSADGNTVTKQLANSSSDLTLNTIQGIVRDKSGLPPSDSASNVTITIYYPNGSGSMTSSSTTPSASGEFSFSSAVPIGIHQIQAVVSGVNDTTSRYIAINPASVTLTGLRFASDIWGTSGGGGGGGDAIILMDGSQQFDDGDCEDVEFDIMNTSSNPVVLSSITVTWGSPTAYYKKVKLDGTVFNNDNNRHGTGELTTFSDNKTLQPGQSETVKIQDFESQQNGSGSNVNMANTTFTILFSDGSSFNVVMGSCVEN